MTIQDEIKKFFDECVCVYGDNQIFPETIFLFRTSVEDQHLEMGVICQFLQNNFDYILKCSVDLVGVINELVKISGMDEFIKNYLNDNFSSFVDFVPKDLIFKDISRYLEKNQDMLNEFLTRYKKEYVKSILMNGMYYLSEKETESINDVVVMIVDEILEHENQRYVDIKKLKSGSYSEVVQIGSKIVKVGGRRNSYEIPNTSVLLQPLIRINLSDISTAPGTIEVVERVETKENVSSEDLYQIYKRARDEGVVLVDLKADNVGVLLKDNVLHFSKSISSDVSTRGIVGENREVLKAGEMVLLDSDHIYSETEYLKRMELRNLKEKSEFEKRYIFEKSHQDSLEVEFDDYYNETLGEISSTKRK